MDRVTSPPRWHFPAAETMILDNGMRVRLVHMPGKYVATVGITMALPTEVETPETEGVLHAFSSLLLPASARAEPGRVARMARAGATVTAGSDHRGPKVIADCPVLNLANFFEELAALLLLFDPTEETFEICRQRRLSELAFELHDSFGLANKLFNESVISERSRYSRSVAGSVASWERMRLVDVLDVHDRYIDPQHMTMVVVGDLSTFDVPAAVARAFADYPSTGAVAVADEAPRPALGPRLMCRPAEPSGAVASTQLMLGCFAVDRLDPRWPSARAGAELLGVGPDSLLNRELRGRLGLSYGIDAKFIPYFSGGIFDISGSVDSARSEEALGAIYRVLHQTLSDGFPAEAFERVRARMVAGAPEIYESTLAVAQQYVELASCDLEESFIDEHLRRMSRLDLADLDADMRTLIDPDGMHVAVVGRFDPSASVVGHMPAA